MNDARNPVDGIIKLAIMAVGGQGGGVLSGWITSLAEREDYAVQSTSVAGVAQRTGATIYYIEMAPESGRPPVFALSPSAGDVDILIASELMEAGRAITRGFVTPDRTVLIASTHRILAVSEKQVPGDGRGDGGLVERALRDNALRLITFDMERVAVDAGSVVSASLFGGLARSGTLPFPVEAFEEVIATSSRGAEASLRAFRAALTYESTPDPEATSATDPIVVGPPADVREWEALLSRIDALPEGARDIATSGVRHVVDYQDLAYGAEYLDHVVSFVANDQATDPVLTRAAAKYLACAMCYDDIIRVADLKTRATRETRLRHEQQVAQEDIIAVTEYFHPRAEEVSSILPAGIGRWIMSRGWAFGLLSRLFSRGRRIRSDRILGFAMLWCVAGLRSRRRKLLRHVTETAHLDRLISLTRQHAAVNPLLAAEILGCQRLIKGYSDTHARGLSKFDRVLSALPELAERTDAADWIRRLREAALADEKGDALDGALRTIHEEITT